MSDKSAIEWTNASWNPTVGCSKVSQGCRHCYAETLALRHGWSKHPWAERFAAENMILHSERLEIPLHWKRPRRIFVDSMSDLFHEEVPDEFIDRVFAVMALTPQHTYQVLTKRPERMRRYLTDCEIHRLGSNRVSNAAFSFPLWPDVYEQGFLNDGEWPLKNVWLGVTCENQRWADQRIPILLDTPAAVRFVSAEPLLGRIRLNPLWFRGSGGVLPARNVGLDWVIVGGESGSKHRPFELKWAQEVIDVTRIWGAAAFVKQLGGFRPGNKLEDLPEDLRVREFPA